LRNSASCWFLLKEFIMMHGSLKEKKKKKISGERGEGMYEY
jgi:hypothetical protein